MSAGKPLENWHIRDRLQYQSVQLMMGGEMINAKSVPWASYWRLGWIRSRSFWDSPRPPEWQVAFTFQRSPEIQSSCNDRKRAPFGPDVCPYHVNDELRLARRGRLIYWTLGPQAHKVFPVCVCTPAGPVRHGSSRAVEIVVGGLSGFVKSWV